jgi:hypothetical protein
MKKFALIMFALAASSAFSQSIPVANYDFSILPLGGLPNSGAAGGTYSVDAIPFWTETPSDTPYPGGISGQFKPTQGVGSFLTDPAGFQYWAFSNGGGGSETTSQTVGATVVAGTPYTLMVDIGYNSGNGAGFDGTADLVIGSGPGALVIPATGSTPSPGGYSTFTATYWGTALTAGKTITIDLNSTGAQGDFTDVRLNAPEGGASSLYVLFAGICCFGAIFLGSRKQFAGRA